MTDSEKPVFTLAQLERVFAAAINLAAAFRNVLGRGLTLKEAAMFRWAAEAADLPSVQAEYNALPADEMQQHFELLRDFTEAVTGSAREEPMTEAKMFARNRARLLDEEVHHPDGNVVVALLSELAAVLDRMHERRLKPPDAARELYAGLAGHFVEFEGHAQLRVEASHPNNFASRKLVRQLQSIAVTLGEMNERGQVPPAEAHAYFRGLGMYFAEPRTKGREQRQWTQRPGGRFCRCPRPAEMASER